VFASRYPDKLEALVIVDVGPEILQEGVESIRRFIGGPEELDSFEAFVELAHRFNSRRSLENLRERLGHNLKQLPNGKWTWKYDRAFRDPDWQAAPEPPIDLWECLKNIPCPTLIVRGEQSDILSPETVQRMLEVLPQGRFAVVEKAGHSVMGDNPTGFEAAVRGILREI
ncbi:MAG: alpha/beta hydrolase, partial [Candidatus Binatia bacterium]|nr:alpha/beta hydrolase [Candidatus Binatia bacterium]